MRRNIVKVLFILLIAIVILPVKTVKAADPILPTAYNNLSIGLRNSSKLVYTNPGYMRVYYDDSKVCIEYYDDNFNIKNKKTIAMELDIWGGFFAGNNAYYVVEGKNNTQEDFNAEVIRVIKYDTNWNRLGAAKITGDSKLWGGEVRFPFNHGCVEMEESNGKLYIVTAHQGYVDEAVGQGHQGFLMIEVDENSMLGKLVKGDYWHSFAQYIKIKDSNIYVLEQSEGSRATVLSQYNKDNLDRKLVHVLNYGGDRTSSWAVACYASVNDMALSNTNVLCLGTSIDQSNYNNVSSKDSHNIYITITPMNNFTDEATQVKWLTSFKGDGKSFLGTKITKINDNRFMVSWEEYGVKQNANSDDTLSGSILHYVFVDANGNKISKEFTASAPISDCHPIVNGSKIIYYASNENMVNFYFIDAYNGNFSKKSNHIGGENVTWRLENNTLVFSGSGTIYVEPEAKFRGPVSSTAGSYISYGSDNSWAPIRDKVEKIVIEKGISGISDGTFKYFSNLKEVEIKDGLKSIGKEAFRSCDSLSKITIPSSVTNIGEDFLWTGSYWIGSKAHVVRATIYAKSDSYAAQYAKDKGINRQFTDKKLDFLKVQTNYIQNQEYTGKEIKPELNVVYENKTLKNGQDYELSYSNNVNTGTASVNIKGKGIYVGDKTVTFKIIPSKIKNIKVKKQKEKELTLQWSKCEGNVTGYKIYQYDSKKKKWNYVGKTKTNQCKVKKLKTGKTYKFKVKVYKTIDGRQYFGNKAITINTVSITKLKKLSSKNKNVTVKWNKVTDADGYAIYMSTNKDKGYKKIKTVKNKNTFTYTKNNLKKNKTYYFKVKTYKVINGKKVYSLYSNIKKIKVK